MQQPRDAHETFRKANNLFRSCQYSAAASLLEPLAKDWRINKIALAARINVLICSLQLSVESSDSQSSSEIIDDFLELFFTFEDSDFSTKNLFLFCVAVYNASLASFYRLIISPLYSDLIVKRCALSYLIIRGAALACSSVELIDDLDCSELLQTACSLLHAAAPPQDEWWPCVQVLLQKQLLLQVLFWLRTNRLSAARVAVTFLDSCCTLKEDKDLLQLCTAAIDFLQGNFDSVGKMSKDPVASPACQLLSLHALKHSSATGVPLARNLIDRIASCSISAYRTTALELSILELAHTQPGAAMERLRAMNETGANSLTSLWNAAVLAGQLGNSEEHLRFLRLAAAKNPLPSGGVLLRPPDLILSATVRLEFARANVRYSHFNEAAGLYRQILVNQSNLSNLPDVIEEAAMVFVSIEQFHDCVRLCRQGLALAPTRSRLKLLLADALLRLRRCAEAWTVVQHMPDDTKDLPLEHVHICRAVVQIACGRFGDALTDYDAALAQQPEMLEAAVGRAVLLLKCQQRQRGLREWLNWRRMVLPLAVSELSALVDEIESTDTSTMTSCEKQAHYLDRVAARVRLAEIQLQADLGTEL